MPCQCLAFALLMPPLQVLSGNYGGAAHRSGSGWRAKGGTASQVPEGGELPLLYSKSPATQLQVRALVTPCARPPLIDKQNCSSVLPVGSHMGKALLGESAALQGASQTMQGVSQIM